MIDINWNRWIFASISKHFDEQRQGIPIFVDQGMSEDKQYFEIRVDGPFWKQISKSSFQGVIEINVLCVVKKEVDDFHAIYRLTGIISAAMMMNQINVYKYGDPGDNSFLGCLIRMNDPIDVKNYGQIEPDVPILQSTVETTYRIEV